MIQTSQLRGLEGNFQAQPRVFAHDAKVVVIGAINTTNSDGGFLQTAKGTNYNGGVSGTFNNINITMSGGGISVLASVVVKDGSVEKITITNPGSGCTEGMTGIVDPISATGTGATVEVTNVDIPNTQERGCCLYVGDVDTNGANVEVVMEGGSTVVFKNLTSGSFLPILIKRIVPTNTNAGEFIALY
jgi:hypothetical protein